MPTLKHKAYLVAEHKHILLAPYVKWPENQVFLNHFENIFIENYQKLPKALVLHTAEFACISNFGKHFYFIMFASNLMTNITVEQFDK